MSYHTNIRAALADAGEFLESERDAGSVQAGIILDLTDAALHTARRGDVRYAAEVGEALRLARNFAARYSDVIDGDYGAPAPNGAMVLVDVIDEALDRLPARAAA